MRRIGGSLICMALIVVVTGGCSKTPKPKGHVSGTVKFNGKPVPAGTITFLPNSSKGTVGEATVALIKDGKYDTSKDTNSGVYAGEYVIMIAGFDGKVLPNFSQGKQIFNPHRVDGSFPEGTSTKDFDVPLSAAENLEIIPTSGDTGN